jgi:3-hydroxyacyl-CoA dehydrogenase
MASLLPSTDAFHDQFDSTHPLNALTDKMVADGYTGRKGKGGFYRLLRNGAEKKKEGLDLRTGEYRTTIKAELGSVESGRKGLQTLVEFDDRGGAYAWAVLSHVLKYAADLIPEIADDILSVDNAMKAGYAWKFGPFEQIDQLGTAYFAERLEKDGLEVPALVKIAAGRPLYREEGTSRQFLQLDGTYRDIEVPDGAWMLADVKRGKDRIDGNGSASLWDLGDHRDGQAGCENRQEGL